MVLISHTHIYIYIPICVQAVQSGEIVCKFEGFAMGDSWISPVDSTYSWGPYLYVNVSLSLFLLAHVNVFAFLPLVCLLSFCLMVCLSLSQDIKVEFINSLSPSFSSSLSLYLFQDASPDDKNVLFLFSH